MSGKITDQPIRPEAQKDEPISEETAALLRARKKDAAETPRSSWADAKKRILNTPIPH